MRQKVLFVIIIAIFIFCVVSGQVRNEINKCGVQSSSFATRIFGGVETEKNEFPWLVAIHHRAARSFFCAGSLISAKHVLSGKIKLK